MPDPGQCILWTGVTPAMEGEWHCVRGTVVRYVTKVGWGKRWYFSDERDTFFFWVLYGWVFRGTDKPWPGGPGACLQYTGAIKVSGGVPWMDVTEDPANPNSPGAIMQMGRHGLEFAKQEPWNPVLFKSVDNRFCK